MRQFYDPWVITTQISNKIIKTRIFRGLYRVHEAHK